MPRILLLACLLLAPVACKTTQGASPGAPGKESGSVDAPSKGSSEPAGAPGEKPKVALDQIPLELSLDQTGEAAASSGPARKAMVTLGMTKPLGGEAAQAAARNLEAYLTGELGGDVAVRVFAGVAPLVEAMAAGEVQLGWLTPTAFVSAADKVEMVPIVKLVRGGYSYYRSALFVRADSGLAKLEDLQGKSVIWAPKGSASGRLFPLAMLRKKGIDTGTFFSQQLTATDHREVCQSVLDGRVDAGATISDARRADQEPLADGCRGAGLDPAKFKVVAVTIQIPNDVIAMRHGLAPELSAKIHDAFVKLGQADSGKAFIKEIFAADGFAEASELDFRPVRDVQLMMGER